MKLIGIEDLRVRISKVFDAVARGESYIVTRHGRPVGMIGPFIKSESNLEALSRLRREQLTEWERANKL